MILLSPSTNLALSVKKNLTLRPMMAFFPKNQNKAKKKVKKTSKKSNKIKIKNKIIKRISNRIKKSSIFAKKLGIEVHAGHGLDYKTTKILKQIRQITEYNIGHFIIGESTQYGLRNVIKNFKKILKK